MVFAYGPTFVTPVTVLGRREAVALSVVVKRYAVRRDTFRVAQDYVRDSR
jgi:hypothetical protein